jgi:DNA-binding transcriptional LysR family regulator
MTTLREIRCFLAVADELSFSRAADRLGVSHARVSQLIATLERRTGGRLVERSSRRARLTPPGAALLAGLRPAYENLAAVLPAVRYAGVELADLHVFLTLCGELHFGRTAQLLRLTQSRVSQVVRGLERRIGARLFDRTSRSVALTPLGVRLRDRLQPAYDQVCRALADTRPTVLRLGFVLTFPSRVVSSLVDRFRQRHPGVTVAVTEHLTAPDDWNVWGPLRRRQSDVLVYWGGPAPAREPDLTVGPVLEEHRRVLLVARDHRLAHRSAVSVEELAGERVMARHPTLPSSAMDTQIPPVTPAGRPIPRTEPATSYRELLRLVASGRIVHPTADANPLVHRDDIVAVPLHGLPPLQLALIWSTAHEHALVRAFAHAATE